MNKTKIKKKKEFLKKNRTYIFGFTAYLVAASFIVWIGSLGFYW